MNEEKIRKINDIKAIEFSNLDKEGLRNICDLIISIWDLEEDDRVREAITLKLNEITNFLISKVPE